MEPTIILERRVAGLNERMLAAFVAQASREVGLAGDIAICLDVAARNARALKHSTAEEVRVLVLHGILHLAGYDHEGDQGKMAKTEDDLRKRLALPSGLIKRNMVKRRMRSSRSRT